MTVSSSTAAMVAVRGEMQLAVKGGSPLESAAFVLLAPDGSVGLGLSRQGVLWDSGSRLFANIAHMTLAADGPLCSCGRRGCLALYISSGETQLGGGLAPASFDGQPTPGGGDADQPISEKVQTVRSGYCLGHAIADLLAVFQPDRLVVGCSDSSRLSWLMEGVQQYLRELPSMTPGEALNERVQQAQMGQIAVAFGAAADALHRFIESPTRYLEVLPSRPENLR